MAKILLVEDDKSLREIYGVRLMAEGYEIVSAGDGEEALALAIKERPNLIVSDVMMPKISGFDMLDILRSTSETKDVKVIMMTALSSDDQRARGEALGADRYLVKSQVGIEDVVRTVHDVLGDGLPGATAPATPTAPVFPPAPAAVAPTVPAPTIDPAPAPAPTADAVPFPNVAPAMGASPAPTPAPAPVPAEAIAPTPEPAPAMVQPTAPVIATPAPVTPAPSATVPTPVAAPAPAPAPNPFDQLTAAPAITPTPAPAAPVMDPVMTAPMPAPAPAVAPAPVTPLPQPTAPFSSPAPASLGQRIIEPLTAPTPTSTDPSTNLDIASQIAQALGGPQQPPADPQQLPPQQ